MELENCFQGKSLYLKKYFSLSKEVFHIKLLMFGPYPLPGKSPYGGVESVITNLVGGLRKLNIEIEIINRTFDIRKDIEHENNGMKIHHFAKRRPKLITSLARDIPALKKKIRNINPDIVHSHAVDGVFASLNSFPTVYTIHGIVWKEVKFYKGIKGFFRGLIYKNMTNYVLKRTRHLILISPYVKEEVENLTNAKTYLIENPIREEFFNIVNREEENRIFCLGIIGSRKDQLTAIKSMLLVKKEFPDAELRIAGKVIDEQYFEEINEFILKNNLTNVKFLGQLNTEQIKEEYSRCSLLVLPSKQETAPMVIAEAMSCGKPVVATKVGGISYMVEDNENGFLFEKGNDKILAEKIALLLKDKELRKKFGKKAKEIAEKRWKVEIIAKKHLQVYKEILEGEK